MDLQDVTAIDAGGIGRLVRLRQRLSRHGASLVIGVAAPRVRRVLQLTTLDAIFGIASSPIADDAAVRPGHHAGPLCRCA